MGNGVNWSDMWTNWGNFGFGGGGMGMPFGGVGMGSAWGDGFNFGTVGDSWGGTSSSSSPKLTDEEKKAQALEKTRINREIVSIKQLLQGLLKDENLLTTAERDSLDYDLKHLPSKAQEKLDAVKNLYNQYKDTIKNNLGKIEALSKDFSGIGYESETEIDNYINELSSAVTNDNEQTLAGFEKMENIEVLDLLSSWNSNSSVNSKRLIQTIIDKYNSIGDNETANEAAKAKRMALENFGNTLKSKLSSKAGDFASNAMLKDDKLKSQLKALQRALDAAPLEYCADTFEDLYEACRIAGAKIMENTYKEKYEFLGGDNLFGNILNETINDLKAEGYDGKVSKDIKAPADLTNKAPKEQLNALVEDKTLQKVTIGSKIYYEEAIPTGGRAYRRVFVLKGAKIQELVNQKIESRLLTAVDKSSNKINNDMKNVDAINIQSDVNSAKPAYSEDLDAAAKFLGMQPESSKIEKNGKQYNVYSVKIGGETKKYARTEKGFHEIYNNQNQQETFLMNSPLSKADLIKKVYSQTSGGRDKGKQSAEDLVGYTNKDEQQRVANCINNEVNAINVWEFLKGYQSNHGGGERFFDQFNNEDWDLLDKDSKKDLMTKVLDYCIGNLKARMEAYPDKKEDYQADITSLETYQAGIKNGNADYEAIDAFTYKYVKEHRDFGS